MKSRISHRVLAYLKMNRDIFSPHCANFGWLTRTKEALYSCGFVGDPLRDSANTVDSWRRSSLRPSSFDDHRRHLSQTSGRADEGIGETVCIQGRTQLDNILWYWKR